MLIAVTPFENPRAEWAATVAHELGGEARSYFFVIPGRGRCPRARNLSPQLGLWIPGSPLRGAPE